MGRQKSFDVKMDDEDILLSVKDYTDAGKDYYTNNVKDKFKKYIDAYNGIIDDKEYSMPEGNFVSKDMMITIHTVVPDIQKLVFTDEPVTLVAQGAEDVKKAERVQALLNYQITQQNNYTEIMEKLAIDSLITGTAFLKCQWVKEYEIKEFIEEMTMDELILLEQQGYKTNSMYLYDDELGQAIYKVTYQAETLKKDQPVYENIPYYELFIDPTADVIENAKFIVHRRLVTLDYLRREKEKGNFKNVDELINKEENKKAFYVESYDEDDENEYYNHKASNKNNKPLNSVMIYEFWGKLDINNDGYLEDVVITYCGDYILSVQENVYKAYPFFAFNPLYRTNKVYGIGLGELAYEPQMVKTTFIRELLVNTRMNNDRKLFYKVDDLIKPEMLSTKEKFIPVRDSANIAQVFAPEPFEPLSPNTQNVIAYFDRYTQQITGVSDIKQGVKSSSDQTATEATIKYEASNSQIQSIALHYAGAMKRLYKFILYQNQQFLSNDVQIRLFNNVIEINTDDLQDVDFDIKVSANLGSGTQETRIRRLQNTLNIMLNTALPMGLTNVSKIRNVLAKILEETGLKDTDNYIVSEKELAQNSMQQQAMAQAMQQQAIANPSMLMGQGLDDKKSSMNVSELPPSMTPSGV